VSKKQRAVTDEVRRVLGIAEDEMTVFIDRQVKEHDGVLEGAYGDVLALPALRAQIAIGFATAALVDQQRAANLLWLARMGSGPISDAYVGEARKLIGPVLAGDQ